MSDRKTIYLLGHTGSINRGCEAIVRSSAEVLRQVGAGDIKLKVHNEAYEKKLKVDQCVELVPCAKHSLFFKAICSLAWRCLGSILPEVYRARADLNMSRENSVLFVIGGDTYCYGYPYKLVAQNIAIRKKGYTNIFWGCSVDEKAAENPKLVDDFNRYSHIVARESLSYELLKGVVNDPDKLLMACDPAFHLPMEETQLPVNFLPGNTVGINLSDLFFVDYTDENDPMVRNVKKLIDYLLEKTDMNICLVPHVYDCQTNAQDIAVLRTVATWYLGHDRICIVDKDYSCTQLKYIISRCRFFVGARTHSVIAAYSTEVPALALSYSIKSRGIAKDLYGDEELVISKRVKEDTELLQAFLCLVNREEELRKRYKSVLTAYKQTVIDAAEKILAEA